MVCKFSFYNQSRFYSHFEFKSLHLLQLFDVVALVTLSGEDDIIPSFIQTDDFRLSLRAHVISLSFINVYFLTWLLKGEKKYLH